VVWFKRMYEVGISILLCPATSQPASQPQLNIQFEAAAAANRLSWFAGSSTHLRTGTHRQTAPVPMWSWHESSVRPL
jgi:hypothetical protein